MLIALAGAAVTGSLGDIRLSAEVPAQFYFGGTFVAFYVIAVTFIAPRFGVGNAIFFVLVGQIASAAAIAHFGLFGAARFPLDIRSDERRVGKECGRTGRSRWLTTH